MKKENAHCIPKNTAGATDKPHSATTVHRVKLALPTTDATLAPWLTRLTRLTWLIRLTFAAL